MTFEFINKKTIRKSPKEIWDFFILRPLDKRLSRFPFTEKIMGSNPIRVTITKMKCNGFACVFWVYVERFDSGIFDYN